MFENKGACGAVLAGFRSSFRSHFMFALTNIGWLMFPRNQPGYLFKFMTLSPLNLPAWEWQMAAYLFL